MDVIQILNGHQNFLRSIKINADELETYKEVVLSVFENEAEKLSVFSNE